jgi:8-oxo-dGTP diphosphatase
MAGSPDYDPSAFPPFAVTVDIAVFTRVEGRLEVVLVERANDPFKGAWALPGGFVDPDEDLASAAARELREETGLDAGQANLTQFGAYGDPDRDPRMRVVTVAYWAYAPRGVSPKGGSDAAAAELVDVSHVLADPTRLAFDHHLILSDAVAALRAAGGGEDHR